MKLWLQKNKNKFLFVGLLVVSGLVFAAADPAEISPVTTIPSVDATAVVVPTPSVSTATPTDQVPTDQASVVADATTPVATPPATIPIAASDTSGAPLVATPPSSDIASTTPETLPPAASSDTSALSSVPSNPDTVKGMIKEETPEAAKVVVSEAVQAVLKESSMVMQSMEQELAESNKMLDDARTQHRAIDKDLDTFYEKISGMLGRLARSGDRLKLEMDKKNELFQKQSYAAASQLITKLQVIMPQLGDYKGALEKLKTMHKEIDVTEEQVRAKIASLTGAFSDVAKLVQESAKLRYNILTAIDEAKAKEFLRKIQANLTMIKNKKNEFKDGPGKEVAGFVTKIKEQMKALEDQAVAQDTKIKGLQTEVDALVVPKGDIPVKVEPLVEKKMVETEKVIVHKKVKIPEKSMVRLSIESIGQAFLDVYQSCKSVLSTVMTFLFGSRKKEVITSPDKGLKTESIVEKVVVLPANPSVKSAPVVALSISEERKHYIELMQQERQAQLARIKEIDEKLKVHGIEVQSA